MTLILMGFTSCSDSDDTEVSVLPDQPFSREIEALRSAVNNLSTLEQGENYGFIVKNSAFSANRAVYVEHSARLDHLFEHLAPEGLIYRRSSDNTYVLAAAAFRVKGDNREPGSGDNSLPPEGFSGTEDRWMWNESRRQWELNVWINYHNPDGIFAYDNPNLNSGPEVVKPKS